jgi:hypothetical protein
VWSRWVESSTRLGGFRALKKTTEAPYTTKVNYREHTSRGTSHQQHATGPRRPPPAPGGPAPSAHRTLFIVATYAVPVTCVGFLFVLTINTSSIVSWRGWQ